MFVTADQLFAHAVGDYVLQSHWMATEKVKKSIACLAHVLCYGLPWLFITRSPYTLYFIVVTHFYIDRYRLARHIVWFKNQLAPKSFRNRSTPTGYPLTTPDWLAFWLLIITDNIMHVGCNAVAIMWIT